MHAPKKKRLPALPFPSEKYPVPWYMTEKFAHSRLPDGYAVQAAAEAAHNPFLQAFCKYIHINNRLIQ
jgi:hypothetical protein